MTSQTLSPHFLYFHGGPGLSSFPDQQLLHPLEQEFRLSYWNEPSSLRPLHSDPFDPEQAFRNYLASAENFVLSHGLKDSGPLFLVAHSFACLPLLQVAKRHEEKVAGLILISPIFDVAAGFARALHWARRNLRRMQSPVARILEHDWESSSEPFDPPMIRALELALADTELPLKCWRNHAAMDRWQTALATDARASVDLRAWRAVLQDLYWELSYLRLPSFGFPIQVIGGIDDPFADRVSMENFLSANPQSRYESWSHCGHYAHLEDHEELGRSFQGMIYRRQRDAHPA